VAKHFVFDPKPLILKKAVLKLKTVWIKLSFIPFVDPNPKKNYEKNIIN
jgi:hypothetical protein